MILIVGIEFIDCFVHSAPFILSTIVLPQIDCKNLKSS